MIKQHFNMKSSKFAIIALILSILVFLLALTQIQFSLSEEHPVAIFFEVMSGFMDCINSPLACFTHPNVTDSILARFPFWYDGPFIFPLLSLICAFISLAKNEPKKSLALISIALVLMSILTFFIYDLLAM